VVDADGPFFDDLDRLTESAAAAPREVRILFWSCPEMAGS
jgi:hypothetical protein